MLDPLGASRAPEKPSLGCSVGLKLPHREAGAKGCCEIPPHFLLSLVDEPLRAGCESTLVSSCSFSLGRPFGFAVCWWQEGSVGLGGNGLMSAHYCVSTSALWFCVLLYEQHGNRKIGN